MSLFHNARSFFTLLVAVLSGQTPSEEALARLKEGNRRFINEHPVHGDRSSARREETALGQEPFAIILGCSDSRVSPEIVFDQGLGDLFTVRVAGNVVGPIELASIEYSALYLHSVLIVVLGHENCGAVKAVIQGKTKDIEPIATLIKPSVKKTARLQGDRLENAIKENVSTMVEQLKNNPVLKTLIEKQALMVKGGYYNFHSGQVEFF